MSENTESSARLHRDCSPASGHMDVPNTIREFNRDYGYSDSDTMFVQRLRLLDLSDRQIAGVIVILQIGRAHV